MKNLLFIAAALLLLNSCKKEDTRPDCEKSKYATLTVSNSAIWPIDVYIDGAYTTRVGSGKIVADIKVSEGNNRAIHATQVGGTFLKATTANIISCSAYSLQVP